MGDYMRFVTFEKCDGTVRAGVMLESDLVVDMNEATNGSLPEKLIDFLDESEQNLLHSSYT
jgi:hypothetical protein